MNDVETRQRVDLGSTRPTISEFTDREYAVIYDAMMETRDRLRADGLATPNLDSAIQKFGSWAAPSGCAFLAVSGVDMQLIKDVMSR